MRAALTLLSLLPLLLGAADSGSTAKLYSLYNAGKFRQACDEGVRHLGEHKKDEKYISLYAFSCLQADKIDRLALPIIMLKSSKEARRNATYFSVLLLQKNLLVTALENGTSLSDLSLPTTENILSRVFDILGASGETPNASMTLPDPDNKRKSYRVYLRKRPGGPLLVIEEYYDTILTKRHIYR